MHSSIAVACLRGCPFIGGGSKAGGPRCLNDVRRHSIERWPVVRQMAQAWRYRQDSGNLHAPPYHERHTGDVEGLPTKVL